MYDKAIAQTILDRLADGESLRAICRDEEMPDRATVRRWEDSDPEFAAKCARAREWQADSLRDEMDDIRRQVAHDEIRPDAARVILANLEWNAAKLNRRRFGEKTTTEHTGKDGGPIQTETLTRNITDAELDARIHELSQKTGEN